MNHVKMEGNKRCFHIQFHIFHGELFFFHHRHIVSVKFSHAIKVKSIFIHKKQVFQSVREIFCEKVENCCSNFVVSLQWNSVKALDILMRFIKRVFMRKQTTPIYMAGVCTCFNIIVVHFKLRFCSSTISLTSELLDL